MLRFLILFLTVAGVFSSSPEENEESSSPDLLEGDMVFSAEQKLELIFGQQTRGANLLRRWPEGVVPYTIDWSLAREDQAKAAIAAAMNEWTSKTCIKFKPSTTEQSYVTFRIGSGCSSHVGRQGNQQFVTLHSGCWQMGTVAHEIGHALGFFHEQSRPDRDRYVRIMWPNIKSGQGFNFMKHKQIDSMGEPYDYGSIMHYGRAFFSKNGRPTILPRKPGIEFGQRIELSEGDARQMNKMYNCK